MTDEGTGELSREMFNVLLEEVAFLRGLVLKAEWNSTNLHEGKSICPWCQNRKGYGHYYTCHAFSDRGVVR